MKLYNTLTRQVDELEPLEEGRVKLYTCGLTVYSQPHIGNWLGYIYWDILVRTLQGSGYQVERTQNITDVGHLTSDDDNGEDKMEKGARAEGLTAWDVAAKYIDIADREAKLLGLMPPDHLVRATDMIDQQIAFAKVLDDKGYLYRIDGDGMYFDTSKLPDYGKLARLDIDGLEAGARVSVAGKRNITDFAVWKFSPGGAKRDMEWDSPWGMGFPGWHLECSVIARETLGDQIDIHTGGIDHIPVHHINEIAQTEAVINDLGVPPEQRKPFSQFWVHNNHLKADGQKMAKSVGNIYTLQDMVDRGYSLDAFRLFALGKHYRTEGNFTWDNLQAAANRLQNWREFAALVWQASDTGNNFTTSFVHMQERIMRNLQDDLNTPMVAADIDAITKNMCDNHVSLGDHTAAKNFIDFIKTTLGIDISVADISEDQKRLIEERKQARDASEWAKSDELRDQLAGQGIGLRDTPSGVRWYRF